ncbi:N-6 DNA methylase [Mucilaginibacter glaciei]|uniref:site-specific DNA-methyltransferase (adenine-specific) n=1 Tax=Mucilaginibacter glaciei TaxID=2772109 RepID=A0A926NVL8_9SPHI|nr:N-6 DNA methylase [Mucilaginibacter glaciei]MBD1395525.1 SAM-dependent DNA methyltransferase [Mucilaginibacter glaciei]
MEKHHISLIQDYRKKILTANKELTKKEAFKDLLNRLYTGNKEIEKIIDAISAGAERAIVNIPRFDKLHRGSADTLYNRVIIEFENNLKLSLIHAKEQLAGYLLGQFKSGEGYNFTLIASDFLTWRVYSPDISQIGHLDTLNENELQLTEVITASFTLNDDNAEDFFYWIDRFLFKEQKSKATLKRIEEAFGYQSPVFIEGFRELDKHFNDVKKFGEVQVSLEQWKKFLSIAYGSFDANDNNFLIHTYLSVFSKMLAYVVVSNDDYIDDEELKGILNGDIFHKYNIRNFVDNDFFHWVKSDTSFKLLKKLFRLIAQELSAFDFTNVDEDILKGVYQELIDLDTRHSLGEYYTPDWLCERIVDEYSFIKSDKILDPACGSGSFLRASIHRIKVLHSDITVEQINEMIYGIDIHPLSVQIAKTTLLLALGKDVINAKKPIYLNITLANTLLAPEGTATLFGGDFAMKIDRENHYVKTQILDDLRLFDEALGICEDLAEQTVNQEAEDIKTFEAILNRQYASGGISQNIADSFYTIYLALKEVKERGRDSIWKFIVQNLYKPYFLKDKFSHVIGNPPWFTYSSIKNEEYQNTLNALAIKYDVKPVKVANFPHLEIAAIFMAYCSSYFLKDSGKIAFVLPRSFFSADHHDNTRSGKAKGFKLLNIWDLDRVSPLFRIPSAVLFGMKAHVKRNLPAAGLPGKVFTGNLPSHNCNGAVASKKLSEITATWFYVKQGKSTAFSTKKYKTQAKINPYKNDFKQGATIVPRSFYFVELDQEIPADFIGRTINVRTAEDVKADAKKPWNIELAGRVESEFIFLTALSKSILPFVLHKPNLIALPLIVKEDEHCEKKITLKTSQELRHDGFLLASKWFGNSERIWDIHKTEKNRNTTSKDYINWQNKLTEQNLNAPYLVLYNSSAKDANATVVVRSQWPLEFIVESVTYVLHTYSKEEAYYLAGILNSRIPNEQMKDFQARGLFGARHVHKKILDIYYPKFSETNSDHLLLANLSKAAHEKAKNYLSVQSCGNLSGLLLGRMRLEIKKHLSVEMLQIDKIVKKIIG